MILSFDIGTTSVKGGLYDPEDNSFRISRTAPSTPRTWFGSIGKIAGDLGITGRTPLEAVLVSGQGPTLVPVLKRGYLPGPVRHWSERGPQAALEEIRERTGASVDPSYFLSKAYAVFRDDPEVYGETAFFSGCPEYITFLLTGNAWTFLPRPEFLKYYWHEEALLSLGLDKDLFPPFIRLGETAGRIGKKAAVESGLPEGVPVLASGPDYYLSLIGTATLEEGLLCDRAGTSEGFNLAIAVPPSIPDIQITPHPLDGLMNATVSFPESGQAFERFRSSQGGGGGDFDKIVTGLSGIRPSLDDPFYLPAATGDFHGMRAGHSRPNQYRAILESWALALKDAIGRFQKAALPVLDIRVCGRPSESLFVNQLKADVSGRDINIPMVREAEIVGNTCVALCSLKAYADLEEAASHLVRVQSVLTPNPDFRNMYQERYAAYCRLRGGIT